MVSDQLTPLERVLERLEDYSTRRNEYRARCPVHRGQSDDSLSIRETQDGTVVLTCYGDCDREDIVHALGLEWKDLFPHNGRPPQKFKKPKRKSKGKLRTLTAEELPKGNYYEFTNPAGEILYVQRHKSEWYVKVGEDLWETGPGVMDHVTKLLYRLPELLDAVKAGQTIYHLEGPKDVESAREKLEVVATTSDSTSSWRSEFRAFYTGAHVVIVADNDTPGLEYAERVAGDLLRVAASVKLVRLPGLGDGEDLTDWLEVGHTPEEFFEVVESTSEYDPESEDPWPEPRPVEAKLPQVYPLDESMVAEPLKEWVIDTSRRMDNAPPDFAATAAVVVCGALLGRKVGIRPKRNDDWLVVANLWGGLVGLPASMKTPMLSQVLRPVKRLAKEARQAYEDALREHELDMMVASAEKTALKKELESRAKKVVSGGASRGGLDDIRAELQALEEPEVPTPRRYTTNDTSVEKMAELLMDNADGVLLYRDELTGWLASMDKVGHETARAFYLEAWNGDGSHEVDRIGRGSLFVEAVCVSVLGGIQPGPLSRYVEGAFNDGESADGLLQRLQVLVYPDRGSFDPSDLYPNLEARDKAYDVFKGLAELDVEGFLGHPPAEDEDRAPEDEEVPYVNFSDEAQEIFNGWRANFEGEVVAGDYPAPLESHFMKYRSLFASLALVFEAIDFVAGVEGAGVAISETNAMRAYAWCAYLREHAIRIYSPMLETPLRRADALLEHIYRGEVGEGMKTREIWRKGWRLLKTAAEVAEALEVLEEHGWVRREVIKPDGGGRPSEVVRLHPELREGAVESFGGFGSRSFSRFDVF